MPVPRPLTDLIHTARTQTGALLDQVRGETAEHLAHLSGRAAQWADQAGAAAAEITEDAAAAASTASRNTAETAERYTWQAHDRLTRATSRWAEDLAERITRIGDTLSRPRRRGD